MINLRIKMIAFFIFVISFFSINSISVKRSLYYAYLNGPLISIEEREDTFILITHTLFINPIASPLISEIKVSKDEEKNLTYVFIEIFKDSEETSITVNSKDLPENINEIILNIFKKHNIIYEFTYTILDNVNYYDKNFTERGYELEYDKKGVTLTIAMGERPTGGYSIYIKKIKAKDGIVTIYVTEKSPFEGEIVTEATTYPVAKIIFNMCPFVEEIINSDTGEVYTRYKYKEN